MQNRTLRRVNIKAVILSLVLLGCSAVCLAGNVTIAWHPNAEPDLQGYKLYYKAESSVIADATDATKVDIPLTAEGFDPAQPAYTLTNLSDGVRYYFAVSAYNHSGESTFNNEISGTGHPGTTPPAASNTGSDSDSGSGGGGCFINALR